MIYAYGLLDEPVPRDVTEVIIHPSVSTIEEYAFNGCKSLVRVTIPANVTRIEQEAFYGCQSLRFVQFSSSNLEYIGNGAFSECNSLKAVFLPPTVTRIEDYAFYECRSLRSIRLPRNLESIGVYAFAWCESLDAVYLPPTVTRIGDYAFKLCKSLKFFHVPEAIEHIGNEIILGCRLLTAFNNNEDYNAIIINSYEVNQWLMQRYANFPFHQACSSIPITRQRIQVSIQEHAIERATEVDDQQMTPFLILCANPHVTGDGIREYLTSVPGAANEEDGTGMTGLYTLCSLTHQDFSTGDAIRSYLQMVPEAANHQDSDGMAPFQHLCRSDVTFFDDSNFSSDDLVGYLCMPPQTHTVEKENRG